MQSYMTRTIASAAVQDKFSGHGSSMHVTSQYPIVSVQSVSVDGVAYSASNGKTTGFVYDEFAVYLIGASFGRGVLNSVIDYTAGYATVPADIVQACARWAAHFYRERSRIGENSKNIQGMVVSFDVKDIPPQVKSVLDAYRKRVPV
jgi:hypothetical protein